VDKLDGQQPESFRSKSLAELLEAEESTSGEEQLRTKTAAMFNLIDADGNGSISKLELIAAVYRHAEVSAFVLDSSTPAAITEDSFDAINDVFDEMAGGGQRVGLNDFSSYFRKLAQERLALLVDRRRRKEMFDLIDADANGTISKLELVSAFQKHPRIAVSLLPCVDTTRVLQDEGSYEAVNEVFDTMAAGRQRVSWEDFELHCSRVKPGQVSTAVCMSSPSLRSTNRSNLRVLIVAPGFGRDCNPRQGAMLVQAGYQLHWCRDIPESAELHQASASKLVAPYLPRVREDIREFTPHVVVCGSQGGAYAIGLWQMGYWRGPTVMINAHPDLPRRLPHGVQVVIAHGSNDEAYHWRREDLEEIASSASNSCMLYQTVNSGQMASGARTRLGDTHIMRSLLLHDCLPRLVDAAVSQTGPEMHFLQSWRERLSDTRCDAQHWLGYSPERLRRLWSSPGHQGMDDNKLFEVSPASEEFRRVAAIFKAFPPEPPAYVLSSETNWEHLPIYKIDRVENGCQLEGNSVPYRDALRRSLQEQGVKFDSATHACWAFHGAGQEAVASIVNDPVAGFQPLVSGSRNAAVWGSGTYFARDAKYVADGQFCPRGPDGTRCMLLCLLNLGMPCLGDSLHKGNLPFRQKPHRYNSSVDCLSSPEVYVIQHPGAAVPAYLITFA